MAMSAASSMFPSGMSVAVSGMAAPFFPWQLERHPALPGGHNPRSAKDFVFVCAHRGDWLGQVTLYLAGGGDYLSRGVRRAITPPAFRTLLETAGSFDSRSAQEIHGSFPLGQIAIIADAGRIYGLYGSEPSTLKPLRPTIWKDVLCWSRSTQTS